MKPYKIKHTKFYKQERNVLILELLCLAWIGLSFTLLIRGMVRDGYGYLSLLGGFLFVFALSFNTVGFYISYKNFIKAKILENNIKWRNIQAEIEKQEKILKKTPKDDADKRLRENVILYNLIDKARIIKEDTRWEI